MPNKDTLAWLEKAQEDEMVVAAIINAGGPWGAAAYHLQQAAQKYLKATLVSQGTPPPRTHDLVLLIRLVKGLSPAEEVSSAAERLSVFAWMTRYPGGPILDQTAVEEAQANLSEIRAWVRATLSADS